MTPSPLGLRTRAARAAPRTLLLLTIGAAACASEAGVEPDDAPTLAQVAAPGTPIGVPDPQGTYLAEVRANGSGCPAGSWRTSISPDGQTFTTTFSRYLVEVNPNVSVSIRDCQLSLKLKTPSGRSFSVQSFSYSGFALLQPGMIGRQTASYYFQGAPVPPDASNHTELIGPQNSDYVFFDDVALSDRQWSPCALDRELNIATHLQLQNGTPRGSGLMNVAAIDGQNRIDIKLQSRSCVAPLESPPSDPAVTPGDLFPGNTVASSLPTWAKPLLGTYAVRTEAFAQSPVGPMLVDRRISLAEFVELPGGALELRTRLCSKEASSLGLTVYIRTPTAYPEERQRVLLASGGWSTEPAPFAVGYDRTGYPGCSGRIGQRVPKRPEQTWLRTATCQCNAPAEAPTYDDCRITDPDQDGAPGLAYKYRGTADAESWVAHSATISRSHYVSGTVDNSGAGAHFGSLKVDETTFQLACEPGACNVSAVVRPCTSEHNGSQFRRLATVVPFQSVVTCEDVLAQAMMQKPALLTPSRCTRDSANPLP